MKTATTLDVLREHCEREGRDQSEIEKTALPAPRLTPRLTRRSMRWDVWPAKGSTM